MQLCFVYVFDYLNLKNIGFHLNAKYHFDYSDDRNELTITENEEYLEDFWGTNIQSLTAIVGNNGAGKTNLLRFVLKGVVEGSGEHSLDGVFVYLDDVGSICYYSAKPLEVIQRNSNMKVTKVQRTQYLESLYYSSHFNPISNIANILSVQFSGMSNVSESWLLIHDMQNYANTTSDNCMYSYRDYIAANYSQNQLRMALFVKEYYSKLDKGMIKIPRYVLLEPNKSGYRALELDKQNKIAIPPCPTENAWNSKQRKLMEVIYYSIVNYLYERRSQEDFWVDVLNRWIDFAKLYDSSNTDVYMLLSEFIDQNTVHLGYALNELKHNVYNINRSFSSEDEILSIYIDLSQPEGRTKFEIFVGATYEPRAFLTGRYYDLIFGHTKWGDSTLSSGEQLILNLLSRLYDAQEIQPAKFDNLNSPQLIILDEAEVGLHPEWQRNFISILINYLESQKVKRKYQIILTSHSPIILSDIPKQCVNFLKQDKEGITRNVTDEQQETFATNIFELYRNSFFLEDGLIGGFAQSKIKYILEVIQQKQQGDYPKLRKLISKIGDKYIRNLLITKLGEVDKTGAIEMLQEQIDRLRNNQ